jgi:hypothetical protein
MIDQATPTPDDVEAGVVAALMKAAHMFIAVQGAAQPHAVPTLRAALRDAAEVELQIRLGAFPSVRLVTIDAGGEEEYLLRGVDLQGLGHASE